MTEVQLFQVLGLFSLAVGLGMLINLNFYQGLIRSLMEAKPVLLLAGVINLVVGYFFVTFYNTWEGGWIVVVTIIGWLIFIKGLAILILPNLGTSLAKSFDKKNFLVITGVVYLILGLIFGYLGYFV